MRIQKEFEARKRVKSAKILALNLGPMLVIFLTLRSTLNLCVVESVVSASFLLCFTLKSRERFKISRL